jgi:hypothetical protein
MDTILIKAAESGGLFAMLFVAAVLWIARGTDKREIRLRTRLDMERAQRDKDAKEERAQLLGLLQAQTTEYQRLTGVTDAVVRDQAALHQSMVDMQGSLRELTATVRHLADEVGRLCKHRENV